MHIEILTMLYGFLVVVAVFSLYICISALPPQKRWIGLILAFATAMEFVFVPPIIKRLNLEVDGTVVDSSKTCVVYPDHRCTTAYQMRSNNGIDFSHIAKWDSDNISGELPVGSYIQKPSGQIDYYVNGKLVEDYPKGNIAIVPIAGTAIIIALVGIIWTGRKKRMLEPAKSGK